MPLVVEFGHRSSGKNAKNFHSRVFWFALQCRLDLHRLRRLTTICGLFSMYMLKSDVMVVDSLVGGSVGPQVLRTGDDASMRMSQQ